MLARRTAESDNEMLSGRLRALGCTRDALQQRADHATGRVVRLEGLLQVEGLRLSRIEGYSAADLRRAAERAERVGAQLGVARDECARLAAERDGLRCELEDARRACGALRRDVEAEREAAAGLDAALEAERERAAAQLQRAAESARRARNECAGLRLELDALEKELAGTGRAREALQRAVEAEGERAGRLSADLRDERARHSRATDGLRAERELALAAQQEVTDLRAVIARITEANRVEVGWRDTHIRVVEGERAALREEVARLRAAALAAARGMLEDGARATSSAGTPPASPMRRASASRSRSGSPPCAQGSPSYCPSSPSWCQPAAGRKRRASVSPPPCARREGAAGR